MSKCLHGIRDNCLICALRNEIESHESDQRQILSWCGSLEEAKLNGEFEHKDTDSYFLKWVKTIAQMATIDIKETK